VPLAIVLRHILRGNQPRLALIKDCELYRISRLRQAKDVVYGRQEKDFSCQSIRLRNLVLNEKQKKRLEKLWRAIIGDQLGKPGVYMLVDEESKNIFCRGKTDTVKQFKKFIRAIDSQSSQVKIEARFVCAEKGYEENIGFQWSGIYNRRASIKKGFNFIGAGRPLSDISNSPQQQSQASLVDWALNFLPTPNSISTNVQLPFVFGGNDLNTKRLNLVLNAAEDRSEIKTILKPTILANDGEPAEILVGENLPIETIVEESVEGRLRNVTTATYKDIGIQLKVHPTVAPDKRSVLLDIFIENSQQTDSLTTNNTTYPVIRTTRSHTKVRLRSGQTTMISGLIKDIKETYKRQDPIWSKIPILGWFFSGSRKVKQDMQLLIFITPTVV
jgi:type II secretory pathway component GspD/PulD (secretin)